MKKLLLSLSLVFISLRLISGDTTQFPINIPPDIEQKAKNNDIESLQILGYCYLIGNHPLVANKFVDKNPYSIDVEKAIDCFEKASKKGSGNASCELGNIYYNGFLKKGGTRVQSIKKAIQFYSKAIEQSYYKAYVNLASVYLGSGKQLISEGILTDADEIEFDRKRLSIAKEYLNTAINLGISEAFILMGRVYENGLIGEPENWEKAYFLYSKALDMGNLEATSYLFNLSYQGKGCPRNHRTAFEYLAKGVNGNDYTAMETLKFLPNKIHNVPKNINSLEPPRVEYRYNDLIIINDLNDWYILNSDSIRVSERRYDKIDLDSISHKLLGYIDQSSVELDEYGLETVPIQEFLFEDYLNQTTGNPLIGAQKFDKILTLDPMNLEGYNTMAYYNKAVIHYNMNMPTTAFEYINIALELDPDFELAKETRENILSLSLENFQKRNKEHANKTNLILDCIAIGLAGLTESLDNVQSTKREYSIVTESNKEEILKKNKEKAKRAKQLGKDARKELNRSIYFNTMQNCYREYIFMIEAAKTNPVDYPVERVKHIQSEMKGIRKRFPDVITKHENEDWIRES
ncbi:MAG: SEL1-like repeat protein [Muribaculaceae bacterium]|nr:SEL1-like repeat protein [Muribaculaceae bacterium]